MALPALHRFELDGRRYVIDPDTCFCFECDAISWDVLEYFPHTPVNHIYHLLQDRYPLRELQEVVGELEWLRASKSILPPPRDAMKDLQMERGLREMYAVLPKSVADAAAARWLARRPRADKEWDLDLAREAAALLLARSGNQGPLLLEYWLAAPPANPAALAQLLEDTLRRARLSGKTLHVVLKLLGVARGNLPAALQGHEVAIKLYLTSEEGLARCCKELGQFWSATFARVAKLMKESWAGVHGEIVVRPGHPNIGNLVETLDNAGFPFISLDVDGALVANPGLGPNALLEALGQNARYYAARLLDHHYFRVEPLAALFARIHNGQPQPRLDPIGTYALAMDANGDIYPSPFFLQSAATRDEFRCGSLASGRLDEEKLKTFDDVGATTTSECLRCWARHLCGGGVSAVHQALGGDHRHPYAAWCEAQRAWLSAAIAAFNTLSSAGVNFSRMQQQLEPQQRPSLFALARAAFRLHLGVRPVEEADAAWLQQWENWNDAAYFTATETGLLLATRYDREMDAVHPRGVDRELVLVRRDGSPLGLLRLRPEHVPGTVRAWVYFRDAADYASDAARRSLQTIMQEAAQQQSVRMILTPAGPREDNLAALLRSLGFAEIGREREALYLQGHYDDTRMFALSLPIL